MRVKLFNWINYIIMKSGIFYKRWLFIESAEGIQSPQPFFQGGSYLERVFFKFFS